MSIIEVWRPLPQFKGAAGGGFECYNPNVDYYELVVREDLKPETFLNIVSEGCWYLTDLVRKHEARSTDNDCWRTQAPRIEMKYCSDSRLRVHKKGMKENNPSSDESDALILSFLELGKKKVKFHYEGGGGLGEDF